MRKQRRSAGRRGRPAAARSARAAYHIKAGQTSGRFTVGNVEVAVAAVAGALLGLLRQRLSRPRAVKIDAVDDTAQAVLRRLGVAPSEAARLSSLPLPGIHPALAG